MTRQIDLPYSLKLSNGDIVASVGYDGKDAARRYADSPSDKHRGLSIVAFRAAPDSPGIHVLGNAAIDSGLGR